MGVKLTKDALDLGIVTRDEASMLAFYRDALGLPEAGEAVLPGIGRIRRLQCGLSVIRLLSPEKAPDACAPGGSFTAATGYRYFTLSVGNLSEVVSGCRAAGYRIAMEEVEFRPGYFAAMVEDPDGNTVELIEIRQAP